MQFDFGEFEIEKKDSFRQSANLEQVMNNVEKDSVNWSNFDQQNNHNQSAYKSQISQIFDKEKSPQKQFSHSFQINLSRDIAEISYIYPRQEHSRSFKFDNPINEQEKVNNPRYEKVKNLLNKAKQNNLDNFYKNLNKMNEQPQQKPMFDEKKDFKQYIKNLKERKRNFQHQYVQQNQNVEPIKISVVKQQQKYNFEKKNKHNDFILPNDFANNAKHLNDDDEDQYKDFDFFDNKQDNKAKQAKQLNKQSSITNKLRQFKKQDNKLQTIREENQVHFEKTFEQQKLNHLINNYEDMKSNFNTLMVDLKDTNRGQQKIINQLKKIKTQYNKQEKQAEKIKRKQQRNQAIENKKLQFQQIKEQINKIKQSNKDLLFLKINEKIQTLQQAVRSALQSISEEKQQPLKPKIINYFCQPEEQQNVQFSRQQSLKDSKKNSILQQQIKISRQSGLINSRSRAYTPKEDFTSPFDLANQKDQYNQDQQDDNIEEQIHIPEFAKCYFPKKIDIATNRNLRKCLTQKSSVVFQSFQFHITAKFTLVDNDYNPLEAEIKVSNKSVISLTQVFVIVYGPQAMDLNVKPSKIYHQLVKTDSSFNFKVMLNKQCLEDGGFSIQISYKNDMLSKKKVNFKVPIPVIQLIKPQFIYQEQFVQAWDGLSNQLYISPKTLDFIHIRSHEDLKLILPFTHISQGNPNVFSYGIMFKYLKCELKFFMKLNCFINGKTSIHLRTDRLTDNKIKQEIMDVMNFLLFSP